jgi:hypothetical protein
MKPARLRLPRQEWCVRQTCFKESYIQRYYPSSSFIQRSWDGDAESLLTLMPFVVANSFCNLLYFGYILIVILDFKYIVIEVLFNPN